MQYALVDDRRSTPTPGQRGHCQFCGEEMVAKCGQYVMWHWAHMPGSICDPWWSSESGWHRQWKERFPEDWREIVHFDEVTGEKHIADVKTPSGVVVEFQRSPISSQEVKSREDFYKSMIWVVDGDRGSLDPNYFIMGLIPEPVSLEPLVHAVDWWSRSRVLDKWSAVTCPVYIEFGRYGLWRFFEISAIHDVGYFSPVEPEWLVEAAIGGERHVQSALPEEERESWIEQFQLVEYSREDLHTQDQAEAQSDASRATIVSPALRPIEG